MLYDLNIAWSPGTPAAELERTLKFAKHLGYDVVALNHIISGPIPTQPTPIANPIPKFGPPHPSYPGGASSTTTSSSITTRTSTTTTTTATTNLSTTAASALPPTSKSGPSLPTTLRRATLVIADPATTNYRLADYARAYDLLAVRPTSDKSFSWACLATTDPPALISLDLTAHLGWHVHHRTAMAAVQRGSRFEVCYAQALAASSPSGAGGGAGTSADAARQRANFICNVQSLVRATKGRGIVLSSEARGALGLRAPADVVNLLAVWGLGPEKGFAALGDGARAVVVNEGIKRRGFRGVVDIVRPAGGGPPGGRGQPGEREDGEQGQGAGGKLGKKQRQQLQGQGQKRKNEDGGVGGGGGGGSGSPVATSSGGGQQGEMSKRQAKRVKTEMMAQAKAS